MIMINRRLIYKVSWKGRIINSKEFIFDHWKRLIKLSADIFNRNNLVCNQTFKVACRFIGVDVIMCFVFRFFGDDGVVV